MTSPRLKMIEHHLAGGKPSSEKETGLETQMVGAIHTSVKEAANAAIRAAEEERDRAQAEVKRLQKVVDDLHREHTNTVKQMQDQFDTARGKANASMESVHAEHARVVKQMQDRIDSLRESLGNEQIARAQAEAKCEASDKMCCDMKEMMGAMKMPAPIVQNVMPEEKEMQPFTLKVSQRDGNGRIAAVSVMPTT